MSKFKPDGIKPAFLQGGFKAFVQTVLPTIYDDSLSYYELLNKVVKYLNKTNEAVNTLSKNQYTFFHEVTDYINNNVVPTFDVVINSTFTTLDSDTVTELYNAVANNRLARIIVSVPDSNISYACYYATHDTETVGTKPANNLYFIGYKLKGITDGTRYFNEVIVKVTDNGQVTTYSDFNIVTKSYVDTMLASTELRLLDYITDYINNVVPTFDVVINSTFTTLDSDTVTELYNAVANNRLARIIVSVPDSNISYACYYATHDTETVETNPANNLYFIGYKLKGITDGTRYFNEVIVKVTDNGQVTTYSDFNIVTKPYVDTMLASAESRLLDYIDDNKTAIVNFTVTRENNIPVVTGTKTPSEIKALVDNGNAVICKLTDSPGKTISNCVICHDGEVIILFSNVEHPYPYTEKAVPLSYDIIHGKYNDFDGWVFQSNFKLDNQVVFGVTRENNDFTVSTLTHTPKEVIKLLENSGFNPVSVIASFTIDNGDINKIYCDQVATTTKINGDDITHVITIRFVTSINANEALIIYGDDSDNTWAAFKDTAYPDGALPPVTATDNGKFLRVVNGAWAAETVPSAESEVF